MAKVDTNQRLMLRTLSSFESFWDSDRSLSSSKEALSLINIQVKHVEKLPKKESLVALGKVEDKQVFFTFT